MKGTKNDQWKITKFVFQDAVYWLTQVQTKLPSYKYSIQTPKLRSIFQYFWINLSFPRSRSIGFTFLTIHNFKYSILNWFFLLKETIHWKGWILECKTVILMYNTGSWHWIMYVIGIGNVNHPHLIMYHTIYKILNWHYNMILCL